MPLQEEQQRKKDLFIEQKSEKYDAYIDQLIEHFKVSDNSGYPEIINRDKFKKLIVDFYIKHRIDFISKKKEAIIGGLFHYFFRTFQISSKKRVQQKDIAAYLNVTDLSIRKCYALILRLHLKDCGITQFESIEHFIDDYENRKLNNLKQMIRFTLENEQHDNDFK